MSASGLSNPAASLPLDTVSWGTLGCGDVVERKSGPPLYEVEGSQLVAVMRRDLAKGQDFARRHGVARAYGSVGELVADDEVNAVYVASPHACHEEHVLAAAAAGKHVLCEKDMALNKEQCANMIVACERAGVVLGVAFYRRCYPVILRARALLQSGDFGELQSIWINDEFPLSHRLDLFHFFGGDIKHLHVAEGELPEGSHAMRGMIAKGEFVGGGTYATNVGWKEELVPEVVDLRCTRGRIRVTDLKAGTLTVARGDDSEKHFDFGPLPWMHWGLVENFVRHLQGRVPLACDGVEGRKSQVIQDLAESLAAAGGGRSHVDYR